MLYELRIYTMHPGRLPAIHKRFSEVTLALFEKHCIHVCDFFEDAEGAEKIYYVCAFEDRAQRDAAFAAFSADPQWQQAYAASHADGPIVDTVESIFMHRVPYVQPRWDK
jgi:hypothetical protein